MSFFSGQGVHLSPQVTADRSQVEAEMTVIRPKGDLIFTLDTYLAADRRTNVQLSWRQLENELLPLVAEELTALPRTCNGSARWSQRELHTAVQWRRQQRLASPPRSLLAAEIQTERDAL